MRKISTLLVLLASLIGFQYLNAETKQALLIGISDYGNVKEDPNKWSNINGANDIDLLTPLFEEQGFAVARLKDNQATKKGITNALDRLVKNSKKGDVVYIHFSMHGQPFEDLNGDEEDGWDEALIPFDAQMQYKKGIYEGNNHLLDDELEIYFDDIRTKLGPTGQLFVVMDACHSGGASRGDDDHVRGTREGFTRSGKDYMPDRTKETNDYFMVNTKVGQSPVKFIEACRSYQVNREIRDAETDNWYGSLSFYIAQAMKNNKTVGSTEWIETIRQGMSNNRKLRKQNMVIEESK